ncbi:MAG: hypothetical protein HKN54_09455 [Flavobacteriaceae bacterium]|nr:hypothetical protein [Flavobacteriaceae bacterium]
MTTTGKKSPYSFKLFWQLLKHGLFLQALRYGLAKIGIDIMPYYWVQEEVIPTDEPKIKDDNEQFIFKPLDEDEINFILNNSDSINEQKIRQSLAVGQECVGLINNDNIAAYMFLDLNNFTFKKRTFNLKGNEAYLLNMFTFNDYRGKNLAPYLRYCCYRYLENRNINVKFSISNYFNKSAIKFKKKLNSKPLKLYMNIELFKKFQWHFVLRNFT